VTYCNAFLTKEELKVIGNLCETMKHWRRHNPEVVKVDEEWKQNKKSIMPQIDFGKCVFCGLCVDACPFYALYECGYANCPVCKTAITSSGYWRHLKSHLGHENDNPPPSRTNSNYNAERQNNYVYEILVLIVTKYIEIFFNIKSSYYTNETVLKQVKILDSWQQLKR
jgi:ferredoxin